MAGTGTIGSDSKFCREGTLADADLHEIEDKRDGANTSAPSLLVAVGGLALVLMLLGVFSVLRGPAHVKCTFDRNELGPMGDHGQWYWDIYKCEDGTERRILVAQPSGITCKEIQH